jgi:hypothetical protein
LSNSGPAVRLYRRRRNYADAEKEGGAIAIKQLRIASRAWHGLTQFVVPVQLWSDGTEIAKHYLNKPEIKQD